MRRVLIIAAVAFLALLPAVVVNETLHRYAPDAWSPLWGKRTCLDVLEDILLSR